MRRWSEEEKAIFNLYVNKIPDEELAKKIGRTAREILSRKGYLKLRKENRPHKFPKAFIEFVRNNYRTMTNKAMAAHCRMNYPDIELTPNSIKSLMTNLKLKRRPEDFEYIRADLVKAGVFAKPQNRKRQPGIVAFRNYRNTIRLCINLENGKYWPYEYWLWEQAYGKIPRGMRVVIIDPSKATVLENLKLIKYFPWQQEVGDVAIRNGREYVKIGRCKWQPRETFIWEQVNGKVNANKYVRKINPELPISIENLELRDRSLYVNEGAKTLQDWFVVATMARGENKGIRLRPNAEDAQALKFLIGIQRANLLFKRALKEETKKLKDARKSNESPNQ